ncbi:hypothetical protein LTS10_012253 [Elasticomyces elasticus]|nr:hypothetical protein LTS10_012253 [Elasticomyces elasticus]
MAALKVFSLPELLEPILLDLSTRDLLFAQQVCKTWHEVIASTPSLQRALFFVPGTKADALRRSYESNRTCDVRRLGVWVNNLLTEAIYERDLTAPNDMLHLLVEPLDAGPQASCHRMYLSQPPKASRRWGMCIDSLWYEFCGTGDGNIKYGSVIAARQGAIDRARR